MSNDRPVNRRRFFREGLRELLGPLSRMVAPLEAVAKQLGDLEGLAEDQERKRRRELELAQRQASPYTSYEDPYAPKVEFWQRPPGARSEGEFIGVCSRSGECTRVCPASAIRLDYSGDKGNGVPYIDPNEMACVMCDGLYCMAACPSTAILATPREEVDMGTAVWHEEVCLRTHGQECTVCVDKCPMGATAIVLEAGKVQVIDAGCTGCGVCQHECPTDPKSIKVRPKSEREGGY